MKVFEATCTQYWQPMHLASSTQTAFSANCPPSTGSQPVISTFS